MQLGYCVSPTVCRPTTSAYMSIRHMEDLKKIRPLVCFVVENCEDVFTPGLKPTPASSASSPDRGNVDSLAFSLGSTMMMVDAASSKSFVDLPMSPSSPTLQLRSSSFDDSTPRSAEKAFHSLRPNLLVMIPPALTSSDSSSSLSLDLDGVEGGAKQLGHYYSDSEWNVLEALVLSHVTCFVDLDDRDMRRSNSDSSGGGGGGSLFSLSVGKHSTTSGFVGETLLCERLKCGISLSSRVQAPPRSATAQALLRRAPRAAGAPSPSGAAWWRTARPCARRSSSSSRIGRARTIESRR